MFEDLIGSTKNENENERQEVQAELSGPDVWDTNGESVWNVYDTPVSDKIWSTDAMY